MLFSWKFFEFLEQLCLGNHKNCCHRTFNIHIPIQIPRSIIPISYPHILENYLRRSSFLANLTFLVYSFKSIFQGFYLDFSYYLLRFKASMFQNTS